MSASNYRYWQQYTLSLIKLILDVLIKKNKTKKYNIKFRVEIQIWNKYELKRKKRNIA